MGFAEVPTQVSLKEPEDCNRLWNTQMLYATDYIIPIIKLHFEHIVEFCVNNVKFITNDVYLLPKHSFKHHEICLKH